MYSTIQFDEHRIPARVVIFIYALLFRENKLSLACIVREASFRLINSIIC